MADEWNTSKPVDHLLISSIPTEIRAVKTNTKTVLEKEHQALGDGNSGGEHKQGSAISYFLPTASAPTQRPDSSTALTIEDAGRLWWDTTTKQLKVLISVGPLVWTVIDAHLLASANTWAAVQTFSEIPIASKGIVANDTYVEARNEADDGNVPLIKAGKNEADDTEVAIVPDKTRTATDAAPLEDTSIPNKKFVDESIAAYQLQARGNVSAGGTLLGGFNVTTQNTGTGLYLIFFVTDFADANYSITANADSSGGRIVMFYDKLPGSCRIRIVTEINTPQNVPFNFIAVGNQ